MIRRGTILVIAVFALLVGLLLFLRDRQAKQEAAPTATSSIIPLFAPTLGEPTVIRIEAGSGGKVEFERGADGKWILVAPETAAADQAAAQAAATQVGDLKVLATVTLSPDVIGLAPPAYTMTFAFPSSETYILRVGAVTPIQDGYYVQLDRGPYQVVDKYGLDILIKLVTAPPYLATPTLPATATSPASSTAFPATATSTSAESLGSPGPDTQPTPAVTP